MHGIGRNHGHAEDEMSLASTRVNQHTLKLGLARRSGVPRLTNDEEELAADIGGRATRGVSMERTNGEIIRTWGAHASRWEDSVV